MCVCVCVCLCLCVWVCLSFLESVFVSSLSGFKGQRSDASAVFSVIFTPSDGIESGQNSEPSCSGRKLLVDGPAMSAPQEGDSSAGAGSDWLCRKGQGNATLRPHAAPEVEFTKALSGRADERI